MEETGKSQARGWIVTLPAGEYTKDEIMEKFGSYAFEGQKEIGG